MTETIHNPIFAVLKLIASHRSQGSLAQWVQSIPIYIGSGRRFENLKYFGSLAQLAVVFHHEERLIEKQGPDERSDIGIQI